MAGNYYPEKRSNYGKYFAGIDKEIDLRIELRTIFYGSAELHPHSFIALYRRLNGTKCTCWNDITKESDSRCPYCKGEAYLWEESSFHTYQIITAPIYGKSLTTIDSDIQKIHSPSAIFYCEYNSFDTSNPPRVGDAVIEAELDVEGAVIINSSGDVNRTRKWRISLIEDMRSDRGRVEFYRISVKMEPL